jgi:hypothetical protein
MSLRPPSGAPPPAIFEIDGREVDLVGPAAEISLRYFAEHPQDVERYGEAGLAWCQHDSQWLLCWAAGDVIGATDLGEQVSWLARVLHARDFPTGKLARNLEIASDVVSEGERFGEATAAVADRLATAAQTVTGLGLGGDAPVG